MIKTTIDLPIDANIKVRDITSFVVVTAERPMQLTDDVTADKQWSFPEAHVYVNQENVDVVHEFATALMEAVEMMQEKEEGSE